jgi:hypothetical protein
MPTNLEILVTEDFTTGDVVRIDDITTNYTTPINATRFLFSNYSKDLQVNADVKECKSNVEYIVTGTGGNTVVVDTKTFLLGNTFSLRVDATPTIGLNLKLAETGRFVSYSTFLPTDLYKQFSPSEFGINSLTFNDSTFKATYQTFGTPITSGAGKAAGTYIVKTGTAVIGSSTYRAGEVIFRTSTFTLTSGTIYLLDASQEFVFPLYFNALQVRNEIANAYVKQGCNCKDELELELKLSKIDNILEAIRYNFENVINIDYSGTQTMLDQIIEISND